MDVFLGVQNGDVSGKVVDWCVLPEAELEVEREVALFERGELEHASVLGDGLALGVEEDLEGGLRLRGLDLQADVLLAALAPVVVDLGAVGGAEAVEQVVLDGLERAVLVQVDLDHGLRAEEFVLLDVGGGTVRGLGEELELELGDREHLPQFLREGLLQG